MEGVPRRSVALDVYISNDQIWQMPEMYEYALETIIPKQGTFVPQTQWNFSARSFPTAATGG